MAFPRFMILLSSLGLAASQVSCVGLDTGTDYFSQVYDVCHESLPRTGADHAPDPATGIYAPRFPPGCQEALEEVLSAHFDDPSWLPGSEADRFGWIGSVPARLLVLEAFYRMISEPAVFGPEGKAFSSVWPESPAGLTPLDVRCMTEGPEKVLGCVSDPAPCDLRTDHPAYSNCRIFNYVLSRSSLFRYDPGSDIRLAAENEWEASGSGGLSARTVTFYRDFFNFHSGAAGDKQVGSPLGRIHTLVHEARHSDGYGPHGSCDSGAEDACDASLLGPFPYSSFVLAGFIEGQRAARAQAQEEGGAWPYSWSVLDVVQSARLICYDLSSRPVNHTNAALDGWLFSPDCYRGSFDALFRRFGMEYTALDRIDAARWSIW